MFLDRKLVFLDDQNLELKKWQNLHFCQGPLFWSKFAFFILCFFTLLAEAFPLCFSALYCHSLRGFGCSRFVLVVSVPRKIPLQTAVWDSC